MSLYENVQKIIDERTTIRHKKRAEEFRASTVKDHTERTWTRSFPPMPSSVGQDIEIQYPPPAPYNSNTDIINKQQFEINWNTVW